MTQEALNKLSKKQMDYCVTLSVLIDRARHNGLKEEFDRNCGKLRGFIECLRLTETIKDCECKALYLWFVEKSRVETA